MDALTDELFRHGGLRLIPTDREREAGQRTVGRSTLWSVLLYLAIYADASNRCWVSTRVMETDCGLHRRTIRAALTELERVDLIRRDGKRGRATVWHLDPTLWHAVAAPHRPSRVGGDPDMGATVRPIRPQGTESNGRAYGRAYGRAVGRTVAPVIEEKRINTNAREPETTVSDPTTTERDGGVDQPNSAADAARTEAQQLEEPTDRAAADRFLGALNRDPRITGARLNSNQRTRALAFTAALRGWTPKQLVTACTEHVDGMPGGQLLLALETVVETQTAPAAKRQHAADIGTTDPVVAVRPADLGITFRKVSA